ncbi:MAG: PHB depolymerase family esterase [Flavobacteriaceae bacterium]
MKRVLSRFHRYLAMVIWFSVIYGCSGQPDLLEGKLETINHETLKYYLYFPEDYKQETNKDYPLLLFLHGGGEAGGTLQNLQTGGPPKMIVEGKQFPFLILAPQHPDKRLFWNTRAVMQLLEHVLQEHRIDRNRVYLSGLSRGGTAAWELAVQYPDAFAAMAVVCGMTPLPYASWINKKMPIWVFHGQEDHIIDVEESEEMVNKLRQMGYEVKFTKYAAVGHEAWHLAYENDSLYNWFTRQSLKE